MKREFTVRFQEITCHRMTVEADSPEAAIEEARTQFGDGAYTKETGYELDHFEAEAAAGAA